jgi:hypothetical protein
LDERGAISQLSPTFIVENGGGFHCLDGLVMARNYHKAAYHCALLMAAGIPVYPPTAATQSVNTNK